MNILVEVSSMTYRVKQGIIKRLAALYPGSSFVLLHGTHQHVIDYFMKQQDVTYTAFYDKNRVQKSFLENDVDYNKMAEFEALTEEKSLWRLIAADREWAHFYVASTYMPRTYIHEIADNDNILKITSGYISFFEDIFDKHAIDVVLPAAGMTSIACTVLEQMCKKRKIPYVLHEILRTGNYMGITSNKMYTFPHIEEEYKRAMMNNDEKIYKKGLQLYSHVKEEMTTSTYFDKRPLGHFDKKYPHVRFIANIPKIIIEELMRWHRTRSLRQRSDLLVRQNDTLQSFMSNISYRIRRRYQAILVHHNKYYSPFDAKNKYVYLPLHTTPEYSTQVRAPMWIDQRVIIDALSKSIPAGWKLYLKEHPGAIIARARSMSFYKEVMRYPNVVLLPTTTESWRVIKDAQLVFNIAGTTGWEAVQWGKPVINIAPNIYDCLDLSVRCTDLDKFSIVIHEEIKRQKLISEEEREKRLIFFFGAMVKHAFIIDQPLKVLCSNDCTEEEIERYGRIIGDNLKKYLDVYTEVGCKGNG